ncbi:MAG: hypothetical protein MI864_00170 [Pseudomonadales bacterium]|nr:hypothetical protein [Pseudomonadales bacterium]
MRKITNEKIIETLETLSFNGLFELSELNGVFWHILITKLLEKGVPLQQMTIAEVAAVTEQARIDYLEIRT